MPERKPWTEEEDEILKHLHDELGLRKWSEIARRMNEEFNLPSRNGKQCRERYQNSLDSSLVKAEWTCEEELELFKLHDDIGNKWVNIARSIPGRTDNCVKNHFFSKLRKSVRKLNKVIHEHFRKQFKEIRLLVINKIIEATDEKFKTFPSISNNLIYLSNRLKNMLLEYSRDEDNRFEDNLELLRDLINEVHQFTQNYKRKPKKLRKNPHVHASSHNERPNDILIVPKVERFKFAEEDPSENESALELVSHESSIEIGGPTEKLPLNPLKPYNGEMMVENDVMKVSMDKNIRQSINDSLEKSSDVEIILRNAGILQNRNLFGMMFLKRSLSDSKNLEDKEKEKEKQETFNFGDSIENLNFLREHKEEEVEMGQRLFENP